MKSHESIDQVMLAVFSAAGSNADIAAADIVWLAKLPAASRQRAVETDIVELAKDELVRRGAGTAAVTAKGLAYIYAHGSEWRKVA